MTVKNMYVKTDNQVKLSDGSSIGYAEYGDPQGRPVLHLHGLPSSRFEANNPDMSEVAARLNVRLLVPDRPGIGLSDFKPYTIGNYPDMVTTFADKLGLDRFAVMGLSSGGKFVAACAWKIPDRLTSASIVSGTAPFDLPGVKKTLSRSDKQLYDMADKIPWLFQIMLRKIANDTRKNPASVLSLFTDVCESDKQALDRPNVKMAFEQMVTEAFHQGTRGAALDWKLEARPWGFTLQEIKMPVYVWHGEEDKIVSIEQARILADAIPNACRKFVKNEGHCLIVNLFEDVLNTTIG
jgi:pimeloyl-ACP methyl ester carboxylesterase